ncbi:hypothetical protein D3C86_1188650 [compost metagenome]
MEVLLFILGCIPILAALALLDSGFKKLTGKYLFESQQPTNTAPMQNQASGRMRLVNGAKLAQFEQFIGDRRRQSLDPKDEMTYYLIRQALAGVGGPETGEELVRVAKSYGFDILDPLDPYR